MPETLARMRVGQVHFHHIRLGAADRVVNRDGRMRVGALVQDDRRASETRLLDPGDEIALVVRLPEDEFDVSGTATVCASARVRR